MVEPAISGGRWKGFRPTLTVLAIVGLTTGLVALPAHVAGRRSEDDRRLLKNYRLPDWMEGHTKSTMQYVLDSSEYNDVIFLGDSTCTVGINPKQFEAKTGLKAYNIGVAGAVGVDGIVLVSRLYLEHHPAPKVLMFCIYPTAFGWTPQWQSISPDLRERFHWCYGSGSEGLRPRHDSPFYYIQEGVRDFYGHLRGGTSHFIHARNLGLGGGSQSSYENELRRHQGFLKRPGTLRPVPDAAGPAKRDGSFYMSRDCDEQLQALARMTGERGILLFVRPTPVLEGTSSGRAPELEASLRSLQQAYPHVFVGNPEVLLYPPVLFYEEMHCNYHGAERFTSSLADELTNALRRR